MRKFGLLAILLFVMLFSACQDTNAAQKPDSTDGHVEDVTAWNGSVIGTTYENATDEILFTLEAMEAAEATVSMTARFVDLQKLPYSEIEELSIPKYTILDQSGAVVMEGTADYRVVDRERGETTFEVPLTGLEKGDYRIKMEALEGKKKAEQPILISGTWECGFSCS